MSLRVAAYCRVSTDREDQANSLQSQQSYFIIGIVNIQNKLVLIMDIQKLFTPSEIERLRQ